MKLFIAYYRVSTDRQGASGLGLEAQRTAVLQHTGAGMLAFDEIVKDAQEWKLVSDGPKPSIREVNKRCNEVMQQNPVNAEEALELLGAARSEIEQLFSAEGGF